MQLFGFITLCLIWGTSWLAIKFSLGGLPPFLGAAIRFAVAVFALLIFMTLKRQSFQINKREWKFLIIAAFLIYPIDYGLIYWGEQYLSAGMTAIFFAPFAIFTAIWSHFLFRSEPFRWSTYIGLALSFIGILVVYYDQLVMTQFDKNVIMGAAAVLLAAAGGGLSIPIVKKYLIKMNTFTMTFYQMLIGTCFLFSMGLILEDPSEINFSPNVYWAVLYLGLIGSALAFVLFYYLLKKTSAVTLALIIYITPVVALAADYIVFDEVIPVRSMIGAGVIFLGIAFTRTKKSG